MVRKSSKSKQNSHGKKLDQALKVAQIIQILYAETAKIRQETEASRNENMFGLISRIKLFDDFFEPAFHPQ